MFLLTTLSKSENFTLFSCRMFCTILPVGLNPYFKEMDLFFDFSRLRTMSYLLNRNLGVAYGHFFGYSLTIYPLKVTF